MPYRIGQLGEVLKLRKKFISIDDTSEYKRIRVQLHQRGLLLRDIVPGTAIKSKSQQVVQVGDVLVAEIDAKAGGFGVVPSELDGSIVSSHYFTFEIVTDVADPRYVGYLMRWPELAEQVAAQGSTNYAAIRAADFLSYRIPLPCLDEQRRVSEHLGQVVDRSKKLRTRCARAAELSSALAVSGSTRRDVDDTARTQAGWRRVSLDEILTPSTRNVGVDDTGQYRIAGIYSFGRGLIERGSISGTETSYKTLTILDEGDVVVSKLNGWEGAVAVVDTRFAGHCVSPEFPTFKPDRTQLLPDFFAGIARSPWFWSALNANTRGSMVRRRRINTTEFLATEVWLPPMDEQARVAHLLSVLDESQRLRRTATAMIDALVPAALNEAFAGLS